MSAVAREVEWPAPANVRACYTERAGGISGGAFESLNLADHVGDEPANVAENRRRLAAAAGLPSVPCWLEQVHGDRIVEAGETGGLPRADGAVARRPGLVCAVLTADCLPVLLTDRAGTAVAAAHAGWRGLAAGVLEQAVAAIRCPPEDLLAWLGPAISAARYEVGDEVREAFVGNDPGAAAAFERNPGGRWQADLYALARRRLAAAGVEAVYGGGFCTFGEPARFFSHRRAAPCGRMAAMIWLEGRAGEFIGGSGQATPRNA